MDRGIKQKEDELENKSKLRDEKFLSYQTKLIHLYH